MDSASRGEVQLENDRFRVTRWTIEPGGAIPMHRHDHDYVVVPLMTGTMYVTAADGTEIRADLVEGRSYTRSSGATHQVENRDATCRVDFIEVERLS